MSRLNFSVDAFEAYRVPERQPLRHASTAGVARSSTALYLTVLLAVPALIFCFLL